MTPSAPSSVLPSPPMSPTSPPTRIRIKQKRPDSVYIDYAERRQSLPPSLSRMVDDQKTISSIKSKRRQSSITYFTPSSPSPRSQRPPSSRSSCLDGSEVISVNGKENASQRSSVILSSRSTSTRESMSSLDGLGTREREPLTLVEKHADLLHFIAQKERKCLELRDQLTAHEKELAELKRKWGRIVNRGHDSLSSAVSSPSISGTALDGLKEGVRIIAAGFTDLGGVLNELESGHKDVHVSTRSSGLVSSIHDAMDLERPLDTTNNETTAVSMSMTVTTAPSLARTASLNHHMHKRTSRAFINEPTTPTTNTCVPLPPDPRLAPDLDVSMSLFFTPSPTLVAPPLSAALIRGKPLPQESPHALTTPVAPPTTAGPLAWMDTMSKRLGGLQKTTTLAKSQKRASSLLAGVSHTINAALTPGPTATTPAPLPITIVTTSVASKAKVSVARQQAAPSYTPSHPHPTYTSITDWLDEEEEHGGANVLVPESKACATDRAAATSVSAFDDAWNW